MKVNELKIGQRLLYRVEGNHTLHYGCVGEFSPSGKHARLDDDAWYPCDRIEVVELLPELPKNLPPVALPPPPAGNATIAPAADPFAKPSVAIMN